MTTVNVNRSLTNCSIINSFLKVIVWMRLVATTPAGGSFFVGDPSSAGGPPRDLLLVANKKNHLVPDKNKTMILATQVAKPSLVLSLPTTTVSNSSAITAQKKKKIIGSFVENKFNLEDCLEELVLRYRNVTSSHDALVTWEEDSVVLLVRPSFSFFPSSSTDKKSMIPDSDDEEEEFFLKNNKNNKHSNPLPFAEVLDQIVAELFLGAERLAKWNDDFFRNLFWMIQQQQQEEWRRTVVMLFDLLGFTKMKQATSSGGCPLSVSSIRKNFYLLHSSLHKYYDVISCYLRSILRHRIVQELGPFVSLLILFLAAFDSIYLQMIWLFRKGFKWFKRRRPLRRRHRNGRVPLYYSCRGFKNNYRSPQERQIVTSSSKRKKRPYKIRREILPFEWHSMSTRLSYKRFRFMLWLQEQYRGRDHKKYMRARKFYRDTEFFDKANRGRFRRDLQQDRDGDHVFFLIEQQILEEEDEEEITAAEEVSGGGSKGHTIVGLEEEDGSWCNQDYDVLGAPEHVKEDVMEDLKIPRGGVTTTTTTSWCDSITDFDGDNYVNNKNHEEVVGTLCAAARSNVVQPPVVVEVGLEALLPTPKPTADPSTNLGSGFYIDSMGRTRRFSHRLLAKKKAA